MWVFYGVICAIYRVQEERTSLQIKFKGAESRAHSLEERFRADKAHLQAGLEDYRYKIWYDRP